MKAIKGQKEGLLVEAGFSEFDYTLHIGSRGRILTEIVWVTFELICVCLNKDFSPKKASTAYDLVETTPEGGWLMLIVERAEAQ